MIDLPEVDWPPVGNKLYAVCIGCGSIVRLDKPIFGSLHVCE